MLEAGALSENCGASVDLVVPGCQALALVGEFFSLRTWLYVREPLLGPFLRQLFMCHRHSAAVASGAESGNRNSWK